MAAFPGDSRLCLKWWAIGLRFTAVQIGASELSAKFASEAISQIRLMALTL